METHGLSSNVFHCLLFLRHSRLNFLLRNRFSASEDIRCRGRQYTDLAKTLLKADMETISLENIQACILVGNLCLADSKPDAESLYFGASS